MSVALKIDGSHPCGYCECDTCAVCAGFGPAAFEVKRDGKLMRLCTKCDLSGDAEKRILLDDGTPVAPFWDWDALGAMCLIGMALDEKNAP